MSASAGGVTSTEPSFLVVTLGLAGGVVTLFDEPLPLLLPLTAAIIPPTAATPAATHNQFGLNAQNGAATLFPPNACGAKT